MTISTERLRKIVSGSDFVADVGGKQSETVTEIARELLAAREAQSVPVALVDRRPAAREVAWRNGGEKLPHGTQLYTAPPAPAVPELIPTSVYAVIYSECQGFVDCTANAQVIWNACRAAMLNHVGGSNEKVPAGFKLVPAESNDAWAERYCELTNKHPDGGLTTYIGDGAVTITFREKSKREIDAMLAAAPTPTK